MRAAGATTVVMREFEGLLRAWSIRGFVCRDLGRARERMGALRVFLCVFERETLDVTDENRVCCACVVGASTRGWRLSVCVWSALRASERSLHKMELASTDYTTRDCTRRKGR